MDVKKIYINTYKYDFQFAKICIASVRYWYPDIPIVLIKDYSAGTFNTSVVEKKWNVSILPTQNRKFGWGYGKLEPLFLKADEAFMVLDADTVMIGPVLDKVIDIHTLFIVDEEVQPATRFNEIYYNLERINEIDANFEYPGYSFNTGQWFGTSGVLTRGDFKDLLEWNSPPLPKRPDILFNGEQGILNFVLHLQQQREKVTVSRKEIMIWPDAGKADFIDTDAIKKKENLYPYIIHWAGMKFKYIEELPRPDIICFFKDYYYSVFGPLYKNREHFYHHYLYYEKKAKHFLR